MSQLLLRLQHAALLASSNSSSLLPAAAAAANSRGLWTAALWQQQPQQQQQQQLCQQSLQASSQLFQQQQQQLPQHIQQSSAGFSTTAAAADAGLLQLHVPPPLPCLLHTSKVPKQRLGSGNVISYPYPLPPVYSDRKWQLQKLSGVPLGAVELPGDVFNVPVRVDILHQVVRWQRAKARQGTHKVKDRSEVSGGGKKPWQQKGSGRARQGSIRAPQWRGGGIVHGPVPRSYAFDLNRKVRRLGLKCALSAKANEGRLILVNSLTPSTPKTKFMAQQLQALLDNQAANSLASASEFMRSAEEAGCSSLVSRQRMLAEAQAGGTEQRREGPEWTQQQHEEQQQREQQQLEAGSQLDRGLGSLLQQLQQPEAAQEQTLPQGQQQQQQQETPGSGRERKAAGLVASRLSAVLIDSAKDGDDGGSLMRRAVNNLPGVEVVPARGANVLSLMRRDYVILTKPGLDALIERLQRPINRLGAAGLAFRQQLQQRRAAAAKQRLIEQNLTPGGPRGSGKQGRQGKRPGKKAFA